MGITLGVLMSVLFALLPLLGTWYVSPLEVLRGTDENLVKPRKARLFTLGAILLFIFLFSFWLLKDALMDWFLHRNFNTFAIMAGIASLFMKVIKKYFPKNWGFTKRQSLLNLFRPNNQTMVLILAIGLGTFLISTLYFTKDILLAKTSIEKLHKCKYHFNGCANKQKDAVVNTILPKGLEVIDNIPIVTMRMHRIKDELVNDIRKDTTLQ